MSETPNTTSLKDAPTSPEATADSRTGQNIGGKGDAYRHIGLHVKKCNQHGTDDRGGTESGKAGAQARAHSREKGYKNCDQ